MTDDFPCCTARQHTPADRAWLERVNAALFRYDQGGLDVRGVADALRRPDVPEPSADHLMQAPAIQAVREVLDQVSDRMDEHAYSEISSALDDIPDCESATAMPHDEHTGVR